MSIRTKKANDKKRKKSSFAWLVDFVPGQRGELMDDAFWCDKGTHSDVVSSNQKSSNLGDEIVQNVTVRMIIRNWGIIITVEISGAILHSTFHITVTIRISSYFLLEKQPRILRFPSFFLSCNPSLVFVSCLESQRNPPRTFECDIFDFIQQW